VVKRGTAATAQALPQLLAKAQMCGARSPSTSKGMVSPLENLRRHEEEMLVSIL